MIVILISSLLIVGIVILVGVMFRTVTKGPVKMFERYVHHGEQPVWVRMDLRGRHRDHCLCFDCRRFHPGSDGNCPVAQTVYQNCLNYDLVTPVWECPRFLQASILI